MADEKPFNISIETKVQLEEIQKLLDELRSISAEIFKINGQTFSAVSVSAAELVNHVFLFAFLAEYDAILQLEKTSHIRGFYLYKLATGQIPGKDIVKNTGIIKGLRFQDFH